MQLTIIVLLYNAVFLYTYVCVYNMNYSISLIKVKIPQTFK